MKKYILFICISVFSLNGFSQCDYSNGKWNTALTAMSSGRFASSAVNYNDSIYILGGILPAGSNSEYVTSVDVYDPASDTWIEGVTEIPYPMGCPNACLIGSKIYILGGLLYTDAAPTIIDSVFIYDIPSGTWERGKSMPGSLPVLSIDTLGGKIYIAGGTTGGWSIVNNLYVYDPGLDEWIEKAPMNITRRGAGTKSCHGKLYAFGGYSGGSWTVVKSIEAYDPETDQWTLLHDANLPRALMAMSMFHDQFFFFGGINGYAGTTYYYADFISRYDPEGDSWLDFHCSGDKFPAERQFPLSARVNDTFYIFGGLLDGAAQQNVWAYSLKPVRQLKAFNDTVFTSGSIELDLDSYFASDQEEALSYNVCPDYNAQVIHAGIENSVLTIEKTALDGGIAELVVNAFTSEDTISSNIFTVEIPLELNAFEENRITVYPNPAARRVHIELSGVNGEEHILEIYNAMGQLVEQFRVETGLTGFDWPVEDYPDGIYYLVIKDRDSTYVNKVIIQH